MRSDKESSSSSGGGILSGITVLAFLWALWVGFSYEDRYFHIDLFPLEVIEIFEE